MIRLLTLAGLLVSTTMFAGPENNNVTIQIVSHGTNVTERPSASLATNVIRLLQSCSVSSTAYAVKADTWLGLLRSDSFVHLTFAATRKLQVRVTPGTDASRQRHEQPMDEIIVPLPEGSLPGHVFGKSGTNVLSFTKYDPTALMVVASEPVLHLSSVQPYSSLAHILQSGK